MKSYSKINGPNCPITIFRIEYWLKKKKRKKEKKENRQNIPIKSTPDKDSFTGEFCQIFKEQIINKSCVNHSKVWKILKYTGVPDHLICFLRKLCAGQEAAVRTGHETSD